eukprot:5278636-Heterocapsa_arctica.AAC.1
MHVVVRPALDAPSAPPCIRNMGEALLIAIGRDRTLTASRAHRRRRGIVAAPRRHRLRHGI